jgi:hypothetical protein
MKQFGGGRLGGVALQAGGLVEQNFVNMPVGPIDILYLILSFSLISTAAAFTAVVDTGSSAAAEGTDDMDLLLNALMTTLTIYADPQSLQGALSLPQWRTVLGLFNIRDFDGSFINGSAIPISTGTAAKFTVAIPIPYNLKNYFHDGGTFHQGSDRMKLGEFDYQSGASLTPTVVLANGSAVVSAYSQAVFAQAGNGTEHDVGPVFQVKRLLNLPTVYDFDAGERLGMLMTTPASTNAATAINVGPYELWSPAQFQAQYQADQLYQGAGFDITARATPIIWIQRTRRFQDFLATLGESIRVDIVSGLSALSVYDIKVLTAGAPLIQQLSQSIGAGGAVSVATLSPPSGQNVPPAISTLANQRILPGSINAANVTVQASPAAAAGAQATKVAQAGALANTLKLFKR